MMARMTTTLSTQGEVAIPDEFREADHLKPGDNFEMRRTAPGRYVLEKLGRREDHTAQHPRQGRTRILGDGPPAPRSSARSSHPRGTKRCLSAGTGEEPRRAFGHL